LYYIHSITKGTEKSANSKFTQTVILTTHNKTARKTSNQKLTKTKQSSVTDMHIKLTIQENHQITWKYCSAEDGSVRSVNTDTLLASEPSFSADSNVLQSKIYGSLFTTGVFNLQIINK